MSNVNGLTPLREIVNQTPVDAPLKRITQKDLTPGRRNSASSRSMELLGTKLSELDTKLGIPPDSLAGWDIYTGQYALPVKGHDDAPMLIPLSPKVILNNTVGQIIEIFNDRLNDAGIEVIICPHCGVQEDAGKFNESNTCPHCAVPLQADTFQFVQDFQMFWLSNGIRFIKLDDDTALVLQIPEKVRGARLREQIGFQPDCVVYPQPPAA